MADKLLMNQLQAAALLGVHRETLKRWQLIGFVPHKVDPKTGTVYYSRPALERWAAENPGVAS